MDKSQQVEQKIFRNAAFFIMDVWKKRIVGSLMIRKIIDLSEREYNHYGDWACLNCASI